MQVIFDGVTYEFPEDITKEELANYFSPPKKEEPIAPPPPVLEPKKLEEPEVPKPGNEINAFELGFVSGEEVVDEDGVRFKVDKYGRFIEL